MAARVKRKSNVITGMSDTTPISEASHAESLIGGDLALTGESFSPEEVANCPIALRFSYGTASLPIFESISTRLAAYRNEEPDGLDGLSHGPFLHPDEAASYITA
jgi:hypothetical protein